MDVKKIVAFPDTLEVTEEEYGPAFKYARKLLRAPRGGRDAIPPGEVQGPVAKKLRHATKNELLFFMGYIKAKAEMMDAGTDPGENPE